MDDLIAFMAARLAEDWGAARDRELLSGLHESRGTRDADAKRAILGMLTHEGVVDGRERDYEATETLERVVRQLASAYSDHPDYKPAWALGVVSG